ncbi:hypothetical protein KAT92_05230 [Candidatus Babeliales bacterium]|nr:hypothetical protein [Candidatus Babeliales bacterium]
MIEKFKCGDMTCPYCGHVTKNSRDEDNYLNEEKERCVKCEKTYALILHSCRFYGETNLEIESRKAACLNGAPHEWRKVSNVESRNGVFKTTFSCALCFCNKMEDPDEEDLRMLISAREKYREERKKYTYLDYKKET